MSEVKQKYLKDENGDVFSPIVSTDSVLTAGGGNICDLIYPIGSIYLSVNSTNPQTLFGGTWVQLKDRFLLGAGSTYSNGSTGGSATHTNKLDYHKGAVAMRNYGDRLVFGGASNAPGGGIITAAGSGNVWSYTHTSDAAYSGTDYQGIGLYGTTGDGSSMPPYLVVYMWKRTA